MKRLFFSLILPACVLCMPAAAAGMPAGIAIGDKSKEVLDKVRNNAHFKIINESSKTKLEGNYRLTEKIAGQTWRAEFIFDKRSKLLTHLIFVSNKAMPATQYDKLLKSFYVFTSNGIIEHFHLEAPINTPAYGTAAQLKKQEMFPMHAYPGDGVLVTMGFWKDKDGGIRPCFSMQPVNNTAMGNTHTPNTAGKEAEWTDIPTFETTEEGKQFLTEAGLLTAPAKEGTSGDEPGDEEEAFADDGKDAEPTPAPAEEPAPAPKPAPEKVSAASTDLPQVEQDVLNALIRLADGRNKEGIDLLVAAGKAGNARALYELGCCYADGSHGLDANAERADAAFRKAAAAGYALALAHYGAEFPEALSALKLSAADGEKMLKDTAAGATDASPSTRFNYAIMLRYGYGVRKDAAKALEMMQQLSQEGDPAAAKLAEQWGE